MPGGNGSGGGSGNGSWSGTSLSEQHALKSFRSVLSVTVAAWFGILLIITIIKLCSIARSGRPFPKKPVIISAIVLYISALIGHTINAYGILSYKHWQNVSNPSHTQESIILIASYGLFSCIALISTYLFTESLLYYSFKGSSYEISKKVIYCHILNIMLILSVVCITMTFRNILDGYQSNEYVSISIFISLLGFGLLHFVYLFNSRLFKIVLTNHDYDNYSRSRNISVASTVSSTQQMKLLKLITKFSVLTSIILIFLFITDIMGICVAIDMSFTDNDHGIVLRMIYWFFYSLFLMFGSLLIFLSFEMNNGCYQCLCRKCHEKFGQVCERMAQKSIEKNAPKSDQYYEL